MCDLSYVSNGSSETELNVDTLDQLYKENLQTLRELIFKLSDTKDIELCRKWLKIFNKTTKGEKMARNCLCTLMQQQLQDFGYLDVPFTDLNNCNRDLEQVLRVIDEQSSIEYTDTFTAQQRIVEITPRSDLSTQFICHENQTKTEYVKLRRELEVLRLHLTEKEIENVKLREIAEKYQLENATCIETFDNIKRLLIESVKKSLQEIQPDMKLSTIHVFEKIFRDYVGDAEFLICVQRCDEQFQNLLVRHIRKELNEHKSLISRHVSRNFTKTKIKLRKKYERRLKMQTWTQKLQLKLVKLKCFSALRQLFMDAQGEGDTNTWKILKALEKKYQTVVDELI